jgi:RHS repeat-associated protein
LFEPGDSNASYGVSSWPEGTLKTTGGDTIKFHYGPDGNRIAKEVFVDSLDRWTNTYYVHDAQGNIMATYQWINRDTFSLDELVMYGSSRLGTLSANVVLCDTALRDTAYYALHDTSTNPFTDSVTYFTAGLKQYEFTNHLGNVLLTLTDRHIPVYIFGGFALYKPEVASAQDYYPFGMEMVGRAYNPALYRFGFNGQEDDNEISGIGNNLSFKYRIEDTRLGRFFSVDPLSGKFVWNSPFAFACNMPIRYRELEGAEVAKPAYTENGIGRSAIDNTGTNALNSEILQVRAAMQGSASFIDPEHPPMPSYNPEDNQQLSPGGESGTQEGQFTIILQTSAIRNLVPFADQQYGAVHNNETPTVGSIGTEAALLFLPIHKLPAGIKGLGGELLDQMIEKVNHYANGLKESDITGAIKDIKGNPVIGKIDGKIMQHLTEVTQHLGGLTNQIQKLSKQIESGKFSGEVLDQAKALRKNLSEQKNKITDALNAAKKEIKNN